MGAAEISELCGGFLDDLARSFAASLFGAPIAMISVLWSGLHTRERVAVEPDGSSSTLVVHVFATVELRVVGRGRRNPAPLHSAPMKALLL
jgi:hypothetical protein